MTGYGLNLSVAHFFYFGKDINKVAEMRVLLVLAIVGLAVAAPLVQQRQKQKTQAQEKYDLQGTMELDSMLWSEDLKDPSSALYREISDYFCVEISKAVEGLKGIYACSVDSFSEGSVIVSYTMGTSSLRGRGMAAATIRRHVQDRLVFTAHRVASVTFGAAGMCQRTLLDCEFICTEVDYRPMCTCQDGYTLWRNGRSCIDSDECAPSSHGCSHGCENKPGSFECTCPEGLVLDTDQKTCVANLLIPPPPPRGFPWDLALSS
jgi:hypothetical protein